MSLLAIEGDVLIHSSTFLWLLLAKGLGIPLGCCWLILEPRISAGKGQPVWGTILDAGAGGGGVSVRSLRPWAVATKR